MGSVYAARNSRLGRKIAIKVISREYTQNAEIVSRFLREAQAVAALDDPNIIDIIDCHEFTEDGLTYIAMKFIDGHSLAALSELVRPMPLDGAIVIALQIASGLDAAHELGIVHRDVKPANVLISHRWRRRYFVTILDFGIAKLMDPYRAANFRTNTSVVIGTLSYMAPEQARADRHVDARADVYSLGVLLYELLTGRLPYSEETIYGLVEKHSRREPFPRPRELRREIPQVIDEVLLDALEIDPRKRLGSMKEFGQRIAQGLPNGDRLLQTLAARLCVDRPALPHEPTLTGDVESSITRWTPARSTPSPRRPWLIPATVAALAGTSVGAVAMHMLDAGPSAPPAVAAVAPQAETSDTRAGAMPMTVERGNGRRVSSAAPAAGMAPPEVKAPSATTGEDNQVAERRRTASSSQPSPAASDTEASPPKPEQAARSAAARALSAPPSASAGPAATKPEPARPAAKPGPRQIDPRSEPMGGQPPSRPADVAASAATEGALVVRTHTWADVWVNGTRRGTAPLRLRLPIGRYAVKLTNDLHDETVTVNVGATETVIEKSW
jgi:serine/threonine protein kinase